MAVPAPEANADVALVWLRHIIAEHGVDLGCGFYRIETSQQALADAEGRSAGTISDRIRRLRHCGLIQNSNPLVVVDPDHTDTPAASPAGGWAEHLLEAAAAIAEAVRHGAPRDALSAQLHLLAMVNGQPAKGPNVVNVDFTTPRRTADTRGPADVAPRPAATEPRSAVASEEVSKGFSRETPLTDFLEPRDEPRTNPRPRPRDATADDAQQSRLKALLAPLLRTIERSTPPKQLNGVSHWGGVIDALGPLTDAQIRRGVDAANRLAQNGKLDSPIGWLIKRAAAADTEIFGPPTEPAGPTATRAGVTEEPSADGAEFVTADQFRERTSR